MARLSGLGKGLGALIPSDSTAAFGASAAPGDQPRLEEIAVSAIEPNPLQPRLHFDEEALGELAESVREIGVLQPVLVRPLGDGTYQLIAGERRWRAATRAGLAVIPAIIRDTDDLGSIERALIENLHRQDLTPLEEAAAYQQLIEDFSLTHEQVATRVGKSRSAVTNTLRLMSLPPSIQALLADGRLSAGHAKALLGTPDRAFQEQLARRAVNEQWSVRMLEDAVRDRGGASDASKDEKAIGSGARVADGAGLTDATRLRPPGLLELEGLLAEHLSTRVSITMGAGKGKVVINFADLEDLERIYHQMTSASGK
ncbi:MAG: ParB/RepB/Spo0J family partition protein [Actinomycetia bacterium]|nr:ParB/RepB/Spo0J family partition protein [Actinomycetes bacterium]